MGFFIRVLRDKGFRVLRRGGFHGEERGGKWWGWGSERETRNGFSINWTIKMVIELFVNLVCFGTDRV